jgi:hypothetical protein
MKLSIRIFVLSVLVAAAAAAVTTPKSAATVLSSRQSATGFMPAPTPGGQPPLPGGGSYAY